MAKTLRIDDQDYADMRRLFGRYFDLGDRRPTNEVHREAKGYALAHAREEFSDYVELKDWATGHLPGKYLVRRTARYKRIGREDIVLLQKNLRFVGYAEVEQPVIDDRTETEGWTYEGWMKLGVFHPFELEIGFDEARSAAGEHINPRGPVQLLRNYRRILQLRPSDDDQQDGGVA